VLKLVPILTAALFLPMLPVAAQQVVDSGYAPTVSHPAYEGQGPIVAIDAAHGNFHTLDGRYAPLGRLLEADGYHVSSSATPLSAETLEPFTVLIIANARAQPPESSAFSPGEIVALKAWVEHGGSLLLIADHAPFGTAAADLAHAFGVEMGQGYVGAHEDGKIGFAIDFADGQLGDHPILHGRNAAEAIRHVRSFTGQSLAGPAAATGLLVLPADAEEVAAPSEALALLKGEAAKATPVGGRPQALAMPVGKGRLVVAGEAAMFSAQLFRRPDRPVRPIGLTVADDQQFALNTLHWLSRLIGE